VDHAAAAGSSMLAVVQIQSLAAGARELGKGIMKCSSE
jgi:hypothetical protein